MASVLLLLAPHQREEDADAEVEAVEDDIGEDREGDQAGPDEGEIENHGRSLRRDEVFVDDRGRA
jgi:hypothetical protein